MRFGTCGVFPADYELFYPLVPIFVSWTSVQVNRRFDAKLPREIAIRLYPHLRSDVQYVTVVQFAGGLYLERLPVMRKILRNTLVLSAGGNGHFALPLLNRPRMPLPVPTGDLAADAPEQYKYVLSFAGQMNGPVRQGMQDAIARSAFHNKFVLHYAPDETWVDVLGSSALTLAPRGTGRTSFRLYEALQLGLIPIYLYSDVAWLPYHGAGNSNEPSIWNDIAFVLTPPEFDVFLNSTGPGSLTSFLSDAPRFRHMKQRIRELVPEYFTYEAVARHIRRFLERPDAAELRCVQKPLPP